MARPTDADSIARANGLRDGEVEMPSVYIPAPLGQSPADTAGLHLIYQLLSLLLSYFNIHDGTLLTTAPLEEFSPLCPFLSRRKKKEPVTLASA